MPKSKKRGTYRMYGTNAEFAATDREFRRWCARLGVTPTKKQASKWRRGRGAVYRVARGLPV